VTCAGPLDPATLATFPRTLNCMGAGGTSKKPVGVAPVVVGAIGCEAGDAQPIRAPTAIANQSGRLVTLRTVEAVSTRAADLGGRALIGGPPLRA
jgi:hypothetical protein